VILYCLLGVLPRLSPELVTRHYYIHFYLCWITEVGIYQVTCHRIHSVHGRGILYGQLDLVANMSFNLHQFVYSRTFSGFFFQRSIISESTLEKYFDSYTFER
jgi:hypothetical protein